MDVSIVIPVYRSAQSLEPLVEEIERYFERRHPAKRYEILLVDDQSDDETREVLEDLGRAGRARVFFPEEKLGQQKALYFGLLEAQGDCAVTMDDDLQHDISALDAMYVAAASGADLVYGVYRSHGGGLFRSLGSMWISRFFQRFFPVVGRNNVSSFRCIDRCVYAALPPLPEGFVYLSAELLPHARKVANVTVQRRPRRYGTSGYTLWSAFRVALDLYRHYGKKEHAARGAGHER